MKGILVGFLYCCLVGEVKGGVRYKGIAYLAGGGGVRGSDPAQPVAVRVVFR